jgi:hypothetical protein
VIVVSHDTGMETCASYSMRFVWQTPLPVFEKGILPEGTSAAESACKMPSRQYRNIRDGRKTVCDREYLQLFGIIRDQSRIIISYPPELQFEFLLLLQ